MARQANFDAVALGELNINLLQSKLLTAKLKLVDSKTGRSFGSTTMNEWGPMVWQKFNELRKLIEEEAENVLFEERTEAAITAAKGIGELFSEEGGSI